ncbi:hypothetical protein ZOSMA_36G00800 [Zostera marina]|uniref:Transposase (putative) gypsy type domain-containing protein n=1 Tax=Zostera marina TaxID=29655 RepID=A0A0K9P607_ZOSMR|nr:hypothetical protein ZOSMA_36G00800 [Zostera marina]
MANQAFIDSVIDLGDIPFRHNPQSILTRNEILEYLWGKLPHSNHLDVGTSLCLPCRSTAASPPDGFTAVYTSYLDTRMPVPASPFLLEFLRFTGIALSQLSSASFDKVLAFEELSHSLGWSNPTMPIFLTFFSIVRKDERVTISTRSGQRIFRRLMNQTQ